VSKKADGSLVFVVSWLIFFFSVLYLTKSTTVEIFSSLEGMPFAYWSEFETEAYYSIGQSILLTALLAGVLGYFLAWYFSKQQIDSLREDLQTQRDLQSQYQTDLFTIICLNEESDQLEWVKKIKTKHRC